MPAVRLHAYLVRLIWICIAPLLLAAAYLTFQTLQHIRSNQTRSAEFLAYNIAASIDLQLKSRIGALQMLAASPLVREAERWQELYEEAQGFRAAFGTHVVFADAAGHMLFNTRTPFGARLPDLPKVKGNAAVPKALATGKPAVGDQFLGPIAHEQLIAIAVPVHAEGKIPYLLLTTIESKRLERSLGEFAIPVGWSVTLRDGKQETIARRDPEAGNPGKHPAQFNYPLTHSAWSVTVELPGQIQNLALSQAALSLGLLVLGAVLAGFVGGRVASRKLLQSLDSLAANVKNPTAVVPMTGIVEVDTIRQSLCALVEQQQGSEMRLAVSERRLRLAQEAALAGPWEWDIASNVNYWSDELYRLYGYEPGGCPATYDNWLASIHPEDRECAASSVSAAVAQAKAIALEWRVNLPGDNERWLLSRGQPQFDEYGKLMRYIGIVMDITERKRAELAKAESEKRFQDIVVASADWIWEVDASVRYTYASESVEAILGYTPHEIVGRTPFDFMPPEEADRVARQFAAIAAQGEPFRDLDNINRHKDGNLLHMQTNGMPIFGAHGALVGYRGLDRDVTQRKLAEKALREREAILNLFIEYAPVAIAMFDRDMRYLAVSRRWCNDYSLGERELAGHSHYEIFPEITETWKAVHRRGLAGEVIRAEEDRFGRADGTSQWLRWEVRPWLTEEGSVGGILIFSEEITDRKRSELELHASQERLRTLFTTIPDLVWLKDPDGVYLACNKRFEQFFGAQERDILGKTDYDFLPPEEVEFFRARDRDAMAAGGPTMNEEEIVFASDGHHELLQTIKTPIYDMEGKVIGVLGVGRDITQLRKNEEELQRYRLHLEDLVNQRTQQLAAANAALEEYSKHITDLYDRAPVGYHSLDPDGIIVAVNDTELQMLGYSRQEYLGHRLVEFMTEESVALFFSRFDEFKRIGRVRDLEYDFVRRDGSILPVLISADMVRDEKGCFLFNRATMSDNRERKQRARQIAELQEALAQRADVAEAANRAKSEFLANMSHEIRTPLNGVLGLAQIGYRNSEGRDQARQTFARILDSGRLLLTIVNDILDFSKIEAGKLDIEAVPVSPLDLAEEVLGTIRSLAESKGLRTVLEQAPDLPVACLGDPVRISQVLLNLLSNAVKFTECGEIRLLVRRDGEVLVYRISDTGIGIPEEVAKRLFQPFVQADGSTTRRFGGTGLGLAISRRLAELMGGQLTLVSQAGQGSTFELRLPLTETDLPVNRSGPPAGQGVRRLAGIRVLAAEDTDINQIVLEDFLCYEGATVTMVNNGRQAVEAAAAAAFDVVLMDVQMPEMDGFEATRRIHAICPGLPVIGQTAHALQAEHERCRAAGMVATVIKPLDVDTLVETVLAQLGRRESAANPIPAERSASSSPVVGSAIVDWTALTNRYPGGPGFAERLVRGFIVSHAGDAARLRALAAVADNREINQIAHQLKGLGGNLCAAPLAEAAWRTMTAAREERPETAALAVELAGVVERMIEELQAGGGRQSN